MIKDYLDYIFAKQIASKERHGYFCDESIADAIKKQTAKKELIRSEWCSLMRRFVDFVMSTVTDDHGNHTCMDKSVKEIHRESAMFVHQSIFHGKTWLVYQDPNTQRELFREIIPSIDVILRDIRSRTSKNKGNIKYYIESKKKKNKMNKNPSSFVSDDEEDDDKENEEENVEVL